MAHKHGMLAYKNDGNPKLEPIQSIARVPDNINKISILIQSEFFFRNFTCEANREMVRNLD